MPGGGLCDRSSHHRMQHVPLRKAASVLESWLKIGTSKTVETTPTNYQRASRNNWQLKYFYLFQQLHHPLSKVKIYILYQSYS